MKKAKYFDDYGIYCRDMEGADLHVWESSPIALVCNDVVMCHVTTNCAHWETALRRFVKIFGGYTKVVSYYAEHMYENAARGYFNISVNPNKSCLEAKEIGRLNCVVEEREPNKWHVALYCTGEFMSCDC